MNMLNKVLFSFFVILFCENTFPAGISIPDYLSCYNKVASSQKRLSGYDSNGNNVLDDLYFKLSQVKKNIWDKATRKLISDHQKDLKKYYQCNSTGNAMKVIDPSTHPTTTKDEVLERYRDNQFFCRPTEKGIEIIPISAFRKELDDLKNSGRNKGAIKEALAYPDSQKTAGFTFTLDLHNIYLSATYLTNALTNFVTPPSQVSSYVVNTCPENIKIVLNREKANFEKTYHSPSTYGQPFSRSIPGHSSH